MRKYIGGLGALLLVAAFFLQAQQTGVLSPPVPPPAPVKAELKFAILGDTGTGGKPQYEIGQKLTAYRMTFPFEFVIMLGDNMYGGENPRDFVNKFEKPYDALLKAGVKFYASLGNHDVPERQTGYKLFNMGGERYYTFKPKD